MCIRAFWSEHASLLMNPTTSAARRHRHRQWDMEITRYLSVDVISERRWNPRVCIGYVSYQHGLQDVDCHSLNQHYC